MDVQVGAARPDRSASAATSRASRASTARRLRHATSSRSGQIGKKTAHHCSGASSMIRSNSAASAVIVPVDPLAARPRLRDAHRREASTIPSDARPPDADDVGGRAALDGEHRRAERQPGRGAEQLDRHPAAGQVAVADEPDRCAGTRARRAARGGPRAGRRCGCPPPRGCGRTSPGARRRRWSPSARRRRRPGGEEQRRAARWRRSGGRRRSTGPPAANASVDDLGRLDQQALVEVRRADGGRPRHLEVVAGVVPERRAHQALERARVGRGRADRATATTAARRGRRRPGAGFAAPGPRGPGARRYQRSPAAIGEADLRTFREVADEPRRARSGPARGRGGRCRSSGRPGIHGRPRARVRSTGLHDPRPSLELVALLGGRRPDRLEVVPLLRRRADRDLERVGDRLRRALDRRRIGRRRPRWAPPMTA